MIDPNFDNHLRETLTSYRTEMDTGALWNNLEPLLHKDKKRRRALIWWWTAGALALVAGAGWWLYRVQYPEKPFQFSKTAIQASAVQTPTQAEDICDEPVRHADTAGSGPTQNKTGSAVMRQAIVSSQASDTPFLHPNKKQAATVKLYTPVNEVERPVTEVVLQPLVANSHETSETKTGQSVRTIATIATINASELKHRHFEKAGRAALPHNPAIHKQKRHQPFVFRLEAEAGSPFKTLQDSPADSITNTAYLESRKNTEKTLEYASANATFGFRHKSGLYAMSGFGFTRINERFYTSSERTEQDSIAGGIVEIYIDSNGDSTFVMGNVGVTRFISYRKRTYNHYTLLDVPVIAGYSLQNGRWSLALEGGVFVNLALKTSGDILSETGDVVNLETSPVFKKQVGLSYYGSLRLGYTFGEHIQLSVAPSLRVFPKNFAEDNHSLIQKYTLAGLKVGLEYRF